MQKSLKNTLRHTPKKSLWKNLAETLQKQSQCSYSDFTQLPQKPKDFLYNLKKSGFLRPQNPASNATEATKSPPICRSVRYQGSKPGMMAALGLLGTAAVMIYKELKAPSHVCHAREYDDSYIDSTEIPTTKLQWLFEVCKKGDVENLVKLIDEGQNINERHEYGWTALMVAVVNKQPKVIKLLLENGANPDLQDDYDPMSDDRPADFVYNYRKRDARRSLFAPILQRVAHTRGYTALHYAVSLNDHETVKLLYQHGVDAQVRSSAGQTAHELPSTSSEMIESLEKMDKEKHHSSNKDVYKKLAFKDLLENELVGQKLAIEQVASVISRLETGWVSEKHPTVLLFVGSTGLGKTEMAKNIAHYLRGDSKDSFLHINLAEYQSKSEAAKLIGAPPGYVGFSSEGEGQLVGLLSKNPSAVVLFDEADKAHPDVLSTLLQLFDEGRLTSGAGKTVECPEAVFVMTANLAKEAINDFSRLLRKMYASETGGPKTQATTKDGGDKVPATPEELIDEFKTKLRHGPLKEAFKRDEFLGRINEVAIFLPFTMAERKVMVEQQLGKVKCRAAGRHGISLAWDESVVDILDAAFDERYGARNMKYEIDRLVVSKLSTAEENGLYKPGDFLHLKVENLHNDRKSASTHIRLYKISPLGREENLDLRFADLTELYSTKIY